MTKSLLEGIQSPSDLKKLKPNQLPQLAEEIRQFLLQSVSKTGGHLSSNLGVIELTIALHYVFDSPTDQIIFDVGHQAYIHKILTGRKEQFSTLRQLDGLSGFLKRKESPHDQFGAGHASTSLSAALGFSVANKRLGNKRHVVAVIGDGSLTGGMAYEALNTLGDTGQNVLIVVNDNEMSIDQNVGALQRRLTDIRTYHTYTGLKKSIKPKFGKIGSQVITNIKKTLRHVFLPSSLFEELGARYYGPVDGHNLDKLIAYFKRLKEIDGVVVLHVLTKKGRGYREAENDPCHYHGVGTFNPKEGISLQVKKDYSTFFGDVLLEMARKDPTIMAITAAMPSGTGLCNFRDELPEQFIDVGIAEENAVAMAAAMSLNGVKPYVAIYSTFLQRAYDQLIHDVGIQQCPVVLCVDRSGLVGADGETHQGIFDTSYLSTIPGMYVFAPKDGHEFKRILKYSKNFEYPLAIKYPRDTVAHINKDESDVLQNEIISSEQTDTLVVTYGRLVKTMIEVQNNIPLDIYNHRLVWPLDETRLKEVFAKYQKIYVYEENVYEGSLAQKLKALFPQIHVHTFPTSFIEHGAISDLLERYGFGVQTIIDAIK